jgi:hypothetical protein
MNRASDELRASNPALAWMVDMCASLDGIVESYKVLLQMERERSARFEAELATLRASITSSIAA